MEYRGYGIENDHTMLKKIVPIGRGSVHLSLRGLYTDIRTAKQAIDIYESRKEEAANDEISKRSGSKPV